MTAGMVLLTVSGHLQQQLSGFTRTGSSVAVFGVDRCTGSLHPDPCDMQFCGQREYFTGFFSGQYWSCLVRDEFTDHSGYLHGGFLVSGGCCFFAQSFRELNDWASSNH